MATVRSQNPDSSKPHVVDILAALLMLCAAYTVYQGFLTLRGQFPLVAVGLTAAVQGSAFYIEKALVQSLSGLSPQRNPFRLVLCWLPFLVLSVTLSALMFIQVRQTELAAANLGAELFGRYQRDCTKIEQFRRSALTTLHEQSAKVDLALRADAADAIARADLRDQKRSLTRSMAQFEALPLLPNAPGKDAEGQLAQAFRAASSAWAGLPSSVSGIPAIQPEAANFEAGAKDVVVLFADQTRRLTPDALIAWGGGLFTDLLPFVLLCSAIPSYSIAERIREFRRRFREMSDAITGNERMLAVTFSIESLRLSGILEVPERPHDLAPLFRAIEEAVAPVAKYPVLVRSARRHDGEELVPRQSLAEQLMGRPLKIELEVRQ